MLQVLTLDEVCRSFLKITVQTGRNRLSQGLPMPPRFKVGRRRLFLANDVVNWIKERASQSSIDDNLQQDVRVRFGRPRQHGSTRIA